MQSPVNENVFHEIKTAHENVAEESINNIKKYFNDREEDSTVTIIRSDNGKCLYYRICSKNENFVKNGRVKKSFLNTISS